MTGPSRSKSRAFLIYRQNTLDFDVIQAGESAVYMQNIKRRKSQVSLRRRMSKKDLGNINHQHPWLLAGVPHVCVSRNGCLLAVGSRLNMVLWTLFRKDPELGAVVQRTHAVCCLLRPSCIESFLCWRTQREGTRVTRGSKLAYVGSCHFIVLAMLTAKEDNTKWMKDNYEHKAGKMIRYFGHLLIKSLVHLLMPFQERKNTEHYSDKYE